MEQQEANMPRWLAMWDRFAERMERMGINSYEDFLKRQQAIEQARLAKEK